jgi:hypothetical protein
MATAGGWREEIVDLHLFFERWLGGTLGFDDDAFARLERALAPEFSFVSPHGALITRKALLAGIREAHGSRPGCEIRIEAPKLLSQHGSLVIVSYIERQREEGIETRRLSSALLEALRPGESEATRGWRWLHVHETWLGRK